MTEHKDHNTDGSQVADRIYELLVDEEDARVCRDIPDAACNEQPTAFVFQLLAKVMTQIGDVLTSPRISMAWLLSALGAPALMISLLVPIRESLSLIPQLVIAQLLRQQPTRKWFWCLGALFQGISLLLMIPAVLYLPPLGMALSVLTLLVIFSLSRGICSVAAKDVLGKTISKTRRGRLNGNASMFSGALVLSGALLVLLIFPSSGELDRESTALLFAGIMAVAALLWLTAAGLYSLIPEVEGATEGGANAITEAINSLSLVRDDKNLRDFIVTRALLIATTFSIPYLVLMTQRQEGANLGDLAGLLIAEGLAGLMSGNLWGRLSDRASHHVMAIAATISAITMSICLLISLMAPQLLTQLAVTGLLLLALSISHQGVRIARKTYLVDIATSSNRAQYTAVSNTLIGAILFLFGFVGVIDHLYGASAVMALLTLITGLAIWRALKLAPAQAD